MPALRVTQRSMFAHFVSDMNMSLATLMDYNIQASSQKKINKPSDDPAGTARVLAYRSQLRELDQYRENIDTAQGWLKTADESLIQVNTVLTRAKELAEQAATGTISKENRDQISYEMRQLFNQLINLSNTEFEGKHIFAGHKINQSAFVAGLNVTENGTMSSNATFSIQGGTSRTIQVQFLTDRAAGATTAVDFRYSTDGGDTWTTGTTTGANNDTLNMNGVIVTMSNPGDIQAVDTTNPSSTNNGTWMWVRPTAVYQGDDMDAIEVDHYGASPFTASASGVFDGDVMVRIDNTTPVDLSDSITYSYSLDRGLTWVSGASILADGTASNALLPIPGGYLTLNSSGAGAQLNANATPDQFVIRPRRAELEFQISPDDRMAVNNVGKEIFGGVYFEPTPSGVQASNAIAQFGGGAQNMFEVMGRLVGYMETNNQDGIQRGLDELRDASQHVLTYAGQIGGKENRLEVTDTVLSGLELNKQERMSVIEDVDVSELMTRLAQQQLVYESVLKSSSMIMRMSLSNYI